MCEDICKKKDNYFIKRYAITNDTVTTPLSSNFTDITVTETTTIMPVSSAQYSILSASKSNSKTSSVVMPAATSQDDSLYVAQYTQDYVVTAEETTFTVGIRVTTTVLGSQTVTPEPKTTDLPYFKSVLSSQLESQGKDPNSYYRVSSGSSFGRGQIVGVSIGSFFGVLLVLLALFLLYQRRKKKIHSFQLPDSEKGYIPPTSPNENSPIVPNRGSKPFLFSEESNISKTAEEKEISTAGNQDDELGGLRFGILANQDMSNSPPLSPKVTQEAPRIYLGSPVPESLNASVDRTINVVFEEGSSLEEETVRNEKGQDTIDKQVRTPSRYANVGLDRERLKSMSSPPPVPKPRKNINLGKESNQDDSDQEVHDTLQFNTRRVLEEEELSIGSFESSLLSLSDSQSD
ncbi:BA75_01740T0 [Komagataella pastoris]|uniref:BA75_01740T0 n=1 Tax=Komagataella pastoris TaxID=4922 RepID=A0A1B2J6H3_PICPA|nr:BA75_01740T0 [Komagataella pastoris]